MTDTDRVAGCIVSAPLRADLTGGYTDVAPFVERTRSRTISVALEQRVLLRVARLAGPLSRVRLTDPRGVSVIDEAIDPRVGGHGLPAMVCRALALFDIAAEIDISMPLPLGTGLGTSGAIIVGVTAALRRLAGATTIPESSLPHVAAALERIAGHHGGSQDQLAATFGGFRCYTYSPVDVAVAALRHEALFDGAVIAIPPVEDRRIGSDRLVDMVVQRHAAGAADTVAGMAALVARGEDLFGLLTAPTAPTGSAIGAVIDGVRDAQAMLHPEIREGIVRTPIWPMVAAGRTIGKPLGGAGRGAAWLLLDVTPEVVAELAEHRWETHPARVAHDGLTCEVDAA